MLRSMWKFIVSRGTKLPLRNIIVCATYAQRCCMQHLWAHARRKLCEIHDSHRSEIAAQGLHRIAAMYAIEKQIRGEPAEVRLAVRQARTAPRVKEFGAWLKRQRARVSAKSRLGEKLAYIGNRWEGLQVFLTDGRVEMDSNVVYSINGINHANVRCAASNRWARRSDSWRFTAR